MRVTIACEHNSQTSLMHFIARGHSPIQIVVNLGVSVNSMEVEVTGIHSMPSCLNEVKQLGMQIF